jgi:hypothetical protein
MAIRAINAARNPHDAKALGGHFPCGAVAQMEFNLLDLRFHIKQAEST